MSRRILSRLARASAAEVRWRARSEVRNSLQRIRASVSPPQWDRRRLAGSLARDKGVDAARTALHAGDWRGANTHLASALCSQTPAFLIHPSMRQMVASRISAAFPVAARDSAARANRIVSGEYDLLGYRALRFDGADFSSPDWHLDPVHGRRAPRLFWSAVPFLDPECGDHKIIWELNRHQHLLVLGRAFWLTGDPRYRDTAFAHISSWIGANPPLTGINWSSMLELGLRVLSWVWAMHFFALENQDDADPWLVDLLLALDRQLAHIEQNLSHYFSPNTHLLGEALALYVAGRSVPMLSAAQRYATTGRRILEEQVARQIGQDGGHLERSTHYHRYTLDFYVLALTVARITNDPAVGAFESAVARLGFAARLLADSRGRMPHIGDDDGGLLLPICGRAPDDVRDSLAEAGALVNRPDLQVGGTPEEAFWMLAHPRLQPALERSCSSPPTGSIGSAALPDTGYYVSRSTAGDHLVIDAGPHGYENGGHAHADALSMTLSVRGIPLLIDPGTGSYTSNPEARDRFRSSMLHNTLVVDGRSQSEPSGPFHWSKTARATAHTWRTNQGFDYLEASHDGYAPLEHRRHVLAAHGDLLIVADLLSGDGRHDVDLHWHLDPRWTIQVAGRGATLRTAGERVDFAVSHGTVLRIIGDSDEAVGWHAPVYGRIEQTSSLRVSTSGMTPIWIVSVFGLNPSNEVLVVEPAPVWAQAGMLDHAVAVRISRAYSVDVFGVSAPSYRRHRETGTQASPAWRVDGYETDGRMLFCRVTDQGARLALVDGSLARSNDRHSLSVELPREVPDLHLDCAVPGGGRPGVAHIGGHAGGAHVHLGGSELAVAVERRSTARATARRYSQPSMSRGPMAR